MEVVRVLRRGTERPNIARFIAAVLASCGLLVAIDYASRNSPVATQEESFYKLARAELARDSSPVDGFAFSKAEALAQVPNEDALLNTPTMLSLSNKDPSIPRTKELHQNDESLSGYEEFNDLLKRAIVKEKAKHISYEQQMQSMLRKVPERRKLQRQKEEQAQAEREHADANALRRLENHLSRHVSGILTDDDQDGTQSDEAYRLHKQIDDEQALKTAERQRKLRYLALERGREQQTEKADEEARRKMQMHIDQNVGNILSSVWSGSNSPSTSSANSPSTSSAHKVVATATFPTPKAISKAPSVDSSVDPHILVSGVKTYIDSEIRREVKSHVHKPADTDTDPKAELAKIRTDLINGDIDDAVKLAKGETPSNIGPRAKAPSQISSANGAAETAETRHTVEKFQHLFGKPQSRR